MKKRALITGVAGQDGSYLSELLLEKDYEVYGLIRQRTSQQELKNIKHIQDKINILEGDITDAGYVSRQLGIIKPHEVYNLAAQSHVGVSFEIPETTTQIDAVGVLNLLEGIRHSGFNSRFYQASTSELFGNAKTEFQNEETPLVPVSPYGCAKLYAHHITRVYREAYNMFACSGILFNHESPRRGQQFVTQKIAHGVAKIALNKSNELRLGNLNAKRDWGHARDYVAGMYLMLNHNVPKDFVLATGETHTIQEFVDIAFKCVLLNAAQYVKHDVRFYRPIDVHTLKGDATLAFNELGWRPQTKFENLVKEMVDFQLESQHD